MKIIYVHHAHRLRGVPPGPNDDITALGEQDAMLTADLMLDAVNKGINICEIVSSPFFRCKKTAEIINQKLNLPIKFDARLNEMGSNKGETWVELQQRVGDSIKDIVFSHKDEDTVICVTSGVNVAAFIGLANKQKPSPDAAIIGVPSCSPLIFNIDKSSFLQ